MFTKVMGFLVFIVGFFLLVIAVLGTIVPMGVGTLERALMFGGGVVTCIIGYYMATLERA
jgi:hypothetical protein